MTTTTPNKAVRMPYHFSLVAIFCLFFFYGCNLITTRNISEINADTYKIARKGEDSLEMRQQIWQEADSFCQKKSRYFMPVTKSYDQSSYEMQFRCLTAGDPELLEGETPFQEKRYHKNLGGYGEVKY